ncbi:hypothetical protein AJ80_06348 [Polytolypa hystricis UAMH7299]|uniref:Oxidoreductase n=1 Tax=Polytolypa hystricis (strain UAMH7299) TaxID=1447883 RepID=A0A2B7XNK4_POLH7|nr:hypothetical protein AJ80_06348 [Polytolypa hystricis UAMH7299]
MAEDNMQSSARRDGQTEPENRAPASTDVVPSSATRSGAVHEILSLGRFMCILAYPLENLRFATSGISQFGLKLAGKAFDPERDVRDQSGKVILITGGNAGLGKETVLQLAKHNPARIYMCARTESKAREAISSIQSSLKSTVDIRYLPLDLTSFKSIQTAAKQFQSECDRLDTLILNAGVMALPPGKTEDGYEIQFGTNHIGHFLLTKLLLPTLRKTATAEASAPRDVRVISVSSVAWQLTPSMSVMTSTPALCAANKWTQYGASKAANVIFAAELARRYPEILSVSLHPGLIDTGLYRASKDTNPLVKFGTTAFGWFLQSEQGGSLNHLWTAGVERNELTNGEFYLSVGIKGWKNPLVHDEKAGKELWEWTEEQVKDW